MKVKQEDESQLVKRQPSKKRKMVIVQAKFIPRDCIPMPWSKDWFTYGKYIDLKTAHDVIAKMSDRKKYMQYRIKGDGNKESTC
jgi:hypothetical protein